MELTFQFDSLADFWTMSGHGPYVWAAYAITFGALLGLVIQVRLQKKRIVQKVKLSKLQAESQAQSATTYQ